MLSTKAIELLNISLRKWPNWTAKRDILKYYLYMATARGIEINF